MSWKFDLGNILFRIRKYRFLLCCNIFSCFDITWVIHHIRRYRCTFFWKKREMNNRFYRASADSTASFHWWLVYCIIDRKSHRLLRVVNLWRNAHNETVKKTECAYAKSTKEKPFCKKKTIAGIKVALAINWCQYINQYTLLFSEELNGCTKVVWHNELIREELRLECKRLTRPGLDDTISSIRYTNMLESSLDLRIQWLRCDHPILRNRLGPCVHISKKISNTIPNIISVLMLQIFAHYHEV